MVEGLGLGAGKNAWRGPLLIVHGLPPAYCVTLRIDFFLEKPGILWYTLIMGNICADRL